MKVHESWETHLCPVRDEDCAGQIASKSTDEVDQSDAQRSRQLLQVSHEKILYQQRDRQMDDSTMSIR